MTNYEKITKNQETLIKFLDEYGASDGSPWQEWFTKRYCDQCDPETTFILAFNRKSECAWCELHGKCKFFQDKEHTVDNAEMIKMWLEESGDFDI